MASHSSSEGESKTLLAVSIVSSKASRKVKYEDGNLFFGKHEPKKLQSLEPRKVPGHPMYVENVLFTETDSDIWSSLQQLEFQQLVILLPIKFPRTSCCPFYNTKKQIEKVESTIMHIHNFFVNKPEPPIMILFIRGDNSVTDFEENPDVQGLLEKCGQRSFTCYKRMNNEEEISKLVRKIVEVADNHYSKKQSSAPQSPAKAEQKSLSSEGQHDEAENLQEMSKSRPTDDHTCNSTTNSEVVCRIQESPGDQEQISEKKQEKQNEAGNVPMAINKGDRMQVSKEDKTGKEKMKMKEIKKKQESAQKKVEEQGRPQEEHCIYNNEVEQEASEEISEKKNDTGDNIRNAILRSENRNKYKDDVSEDPEDLKKEHSCMKFPDIFCKLRTSYPNKLTNADAVNIIMTSFQKEQSLTDEEKIEYYLDKLLKLDYRARSLTFNKGSVGSEVEDVFNNFEDFLNEENEYNSTIECNMQTEMHPMDVQMAVFHCADSFLRQNMVTKLSTCQYALPLLVPSPTSAEIEFPLWTFREIKKTWKSVGDSSISLPVCQVKAPMVFFCRLGSVSTSKSQLLNSLINPKHDTFFHRNSQGSSKSRIFMDGMVEIAWYCPAGNTDDHFRECTAFCNLHGDAVEHRRQTDFLTEQATVNIVLVQNMKLNDEAKNFLKKLFNDSSKHLICLVNDLQKSPLTISSGNNIKIGLRDRNQAELHNELIEAVRMCLQKCKSSPTFNLEKSSELAKRCGFRVDEDSEDCQEGKNAALEVMKLLKGEDISHIKAKFLPCQGKLWHEWSQMNKQLYRLCGNVEQTKSTIQQEMHSIRNQQRKHSCNRLIKAVHENLNSKHIIKKVYFVKWLGVYLDGSFSDQLSEVTQQYYKQLSEVYLLKQKGQMTEEKQEELERLSEKVDAMTLGLEHIVREMGQLYEAWSSKPEEMGADVSALPALAADLLISGHPLELMDGDAAHVPLTWIESVLDKVIERLGDQRVFVLSVLGLQSSGKSTMLNTMFGLQFAVSAGRCTRGAFMQLIRVKEEAKEELKFDYILVVDTEGIRALELTGKTKISHDNELATFVIGLANTTLINVFGENPAEIQEVLEVAIQAILRMNNMRVNPSCMFVHQNVTDITAAQTNMEGQRCLLKKLDEVIHSVAQTEDCDLKCFSNVVRFNIQTDVHYIAQLWEGNPPMAPPNPRYSENIENLKQAILRSAAQKKPLRFSELKVRIKDLWTAVINEDFMFSFKNTLEMAAYRKLEVMYGNWTRALRKELVCIENKIQNRIESINNQTIKTNQKLIHEEMHRTFCNIRRDMEKFFSENKDTNITVQWKERTEKRIQELKNNLVKETAMKLCKANEHK